MIIMKFIDYFEENLVDDLSVELWYLVLLLLKDLEMSIGVEECSLDDISYSTFFVGNSLFF